MAIYHFTAKVVSRAKGQSAIAKAAYNNRERLEDERTGETFDYRRKGGIAFSGIFAPEDAPPEWVTDRATLYNAIERGEKRKDAQLVREIEIGLPHELTAEQRERLVKDFVREQFVRKGMLADVSIHAPGDDGDERNHHAHILLTMRELGPDGFGAKVREWNGKEQLEHWRESWENIANRYLERHGVEARIDRRTLEEQGIEREPTVHRGPQVIAMERDGIATDRGAQWRETREHNATRAELMAELSALQNEIRAIETEAYLDAADKGRDAWDDAPHDAAIAKETIERQFVEPAQGAYAEIHEPEPNRRGAPAAPSPDIDFRIAAHVAERVLGKVLDAAADGFEVTLEAAATSIESLFDPVPAPTPRARPKAREEPSPKPDLRRYLADEDYRRQVARQEIMERQRREREYYERQRERER